MIHVVDNSFPLYTCPLTGLPLDGRASFRAASTPPNVLYIFEPIGTAIIDLGLLVSLSNDEQLGRLKTRTDLAGACRAAKERKQSPLDITNYYYGDSESNWPQTFEDKQAHFIRLLYESGGNEHRSRTIRTLEDFPMAFASDAEQFHRIIESALDERLIRYNESWTVQGDWKDNIQILYNNVLLTQSGKLSLRPVSPISSRMASTTINFGANGSLQLVQGDGAVQTNVDGKNASVNVAKGDNNVQTNQKGQTASLPEFIAQLKQELSASTFDSYREEIDDELERIEVQSRKNEPKKSILEKAFGYLQEMAVKSAGPAAAGAVGELIKHGPAILESWHIG